ncbi:MAG TPA: hypothetical protein EYP40_04770 [Chromatiales bacterium]|nr:hypothetical protein [Chromatiales bacterium]
MISGRTPELRFQRIGILLAGLALCVPSVAEPDRLAQLFAGLAATPPPDQRYIEQKHFDFFEAPLEQRGILRYRPPDTVIKEQQEPEFQYVEIRGDTVFIQEPSGSRRISLDRLPLLRAFVAPLRATLRGDLGTLQNHYRIEYRGSPQDWSLLLEPRDTELANYLQSIRIQGADHRIGQMEIIETNGDWSRMQLTPLRPRRAHD